MKANQRSNHRSEDGSLLAVVQAMIHQGETEAIALLRHSPMLARQSLAEGATRQGATDFFLHEIKHYLYAGDTLLHAAAAGYRSRISRALLECGADVSARNRRGAEPLHYAADGSPTGHTWDPKAQSEIIALLIEAGASPNALDKSGVAPLHRAVRQRCSSAVDALLKRGAQVRLKNKSGSSPLHLAVQNTGKGGTGSPESKSHQREIIQILLRAGAMPHDRDGKGKTVIDCIREDWIRAIFPES
ncbi:MAG TPA: ankyrin repeat domain-containing protein [Candidatus Angelobacter sp.]|nr:ankyrin repeat domain-containing protein [Candidatus Angelobacter sp.]